MKKVLFISNIPAPYRIDFFNELGKEVELTVLFEARTTPFTVFNYNLDDIQNFRAIFLRTGISGNKKWTGASCATSNEMRMTRSL